MGGRRKCIGCKFGKNKGTDYSPIWGCTLPIGENAKVCEYNKARVKNFFTPKKVSP